MDCIIIDDELTARVIISQLCAKVKSLNVVEEFSNAIQAIKYLNQNDVELTFLDIHMPDFTGFDFIQTLKNPPKIILTTSDSKLAIKAFEYDCIVDYLVKPIDLPRFRKAVKKAELITLRDKENPKLENAEISSSNELYININRRLIKIDIPSICLIEAKGDYINIKTEDKNYLVHTTLKKIEEKLPKPMFLKVHRSYVININKIIDIEDNTVLIKKDVIPLSRSNRQDLMRQLNLL